MTDNSVLTDEERKLVAEALAMLPAGPWTVASSNSFRRINGPDSKDGGVLHAYAQRGDGHPDLSMPEQVLWALCRVVNAAPGLLAELSRLEGENERLREAAKLSEAKSDMLADSNYLAGVTAGWNAAQDGNPNEALAKIQNSRKGHIGAYRAALSRKDQAG